jgi:multicomponent Na+:H+ antiporter subunit D
MHFIINYDYFINNFSIILKYFSLGSIIISTIFTLFSKELKHIIIYASCSQVGLFIFVSLISSNQTLLLWMIIIDAINKSFLFLIVAYMEIHYNNKLLEIFTLIVLFSNASLPLTPLFFIKIQIFELLLQSNMLIEFVILIISSSLSIIYYYNIFNIMKFDYTLQKC